MPVFGKTHVATAGERDIVVSRSFDAPRELVWQAFHTPALVKQWLGPKRWKMTTCEIDLRVGGRYRYEWQADSGERMGMGGSYRAIQAPERVVTDEKFDEAWYEGDCTGTYVFTEQGGRTTMTLTLRYDSQAIRDTVAAGPATSGLEQSYGQLAEVLERLAKQPAAANA